MDAKEAKEIIRAGFAWANWTAEQKEAFKISYNAIEKVERYENALKFGVKYLQNSDNRQIQLVKNALKEALEDNA